MIEQNIFIEPLQGYTSDSSADTKLGVKLHLFSTVTHGSRMFFFRGGPTMTIFFSLGDERIQIVLKASHRRPASETPLIWRFAGGSMVGPSLNDGLVAL